MTFGLVFLAFECFHRDVSCALHRRVDGSLIAVCDDNKDEYVDLYVQHKLVECRLAQLNAIKQGANKTCLLLLFIFCSFCSLHVSFSRFLHSESGFISAISVSK